MKIYPEVQVQSVFLKTRMVDKVLRNKPPMRSILKRAEDYDKGNEDNLNVAPVNRLNTVNRLIWHLLIHSPNRPQGFSEHSSESTHSPPS